MRLKMVSVLAALVAALTFVQWASPAAPALATPCPLNIKSDFISENWTNGRTYTNVNGVRAPVQVRFTGTVCGGGPEPGFDAAWISLEPSDGSSITQIGLIHQSITMGQEYCKFWAVVPQDGGAHTYDCGSGNLSDGTYYYFEITEYTDPTTHAKLYDVEDCGTDGYGSCSGEATPAPGAYTTPWAINAAETDYGQTACTLQIMGSSSGILHFGASASPMQFQQGEGSSWATKSLSDARPICSDYRGDYSDVVLGTYDDRN